MNDWQDLSVSNSRRNCHSWIGPLPVGKEETQKNHKLTPLPAPTRTNVHDQTRIIDLIINLIYLLYRSERNLRFYSIAQICSHLCKNEVRFFMVTKDLKQVMAFPSYGSFKPHSHLPTAAFPAPGLVLKSLAWQMFYRKKTISARTTATRPSQHLWEFSDLGDFVQAPLFLKQIKKCIWFLLDLTCLPAPCFG